MLSRLNKTAVVALSALTLAVPVATTATTPAAAQGWHGGGWGWRGGGWRGGYWGGGWGWGGPVAAGLIGGLALGALAASAAAAPYYGYGGCYLQSQPIYNGGGQFVGYRPVRVCY